MFLYASISGKLNENVDVLKILNELYNKCLNWVLKIPGYKAVFIAVSFRIW